MDPQNIIDPGTINQLKEDMGADFLVELIDTYITETAAMIEQLRQALSSGNPITFGRIAHSIKSSSASLGALVFSKQARELEMLGKANDLSGVGPKVEQLADDFIQVQRCLEELKNEP